MLEVGMCWSSFGYFPNQEWVAWSFSTHSVLWDKISPCFELKAEL